MADITVEPFDEVYVRVRCEQDIAEELYERFHLDVPGHENIPSFRYGYWDGKTALFNKRKGLLYKGLIAHLHSFVDEGQYEIAISPKLVVPAGFTGDDFEELAGHCNLPLTPRDYQKDAVVKCVNDERKIVLLPTASGKSLVIYMLMRHYHRKDMRTLLIVPRINLVEQMSKDFTDYGWTEETHRLRGGLDPASEAPITVTTWQTAVKQSKAWFAQYDVVIGDEAHTFKAASLKTIMEGMKQCRYRFGLTGSLDGTHTNETVLEGMFGPKDRPLTATGEAATTSVLMDRGDLANLDIKVLTLKYPKADIKTVQAILKNKALRPTDRYQAELEFLLESERRNVFMAKMITALRGNTMVFFQRVEGHGVPLYERIKAATDRPVYFIAGKVDVEDREEIRRIVETETDAIIVLSLGTSSTGTNIINVRNIVYAHPFKGLIQTLQTIGRGLRKKGDKTECTLYDVADDLSTAAKQNFTLKQLYKRIETYNAESFRYKIIPLDLE